MKFFYFFIVFSLIFGGLCDPINELSSKIKCYKCKGSNKDCTQNPERVDYEKCYSQKCYALVNDVGLNERGCYDEKTSNCENGTNCLICNDSYCNNQVIPSNRLQCYYCDGEDCFLNKISTLYSMDNEENACYTLRDGKTIIQRGFVSKSGVYDKCLKDEGHCKTCNTKKCNNHMYWEGTTSETTTSVEDVEPTTSVGGVEPTTSVGGVQPTTENTPKPSDPSPELKDFSCYRCRSDLASYCSENLASGHVNACRQTINEDNLGCYTDVHDDGVIYRGCLADIVDHKILRRCWDEEYDKCHICLEPNCNNGKAASSAYSYLKMIPIATIILSGCSSLIL